MKKKLLATGTLSLAGLVGVGVMSFPTLAAAGSTGDDVYNKREQGVSEVLVVDDDDDDDTRDRTRSRDTGVTGNGADHTRSRASRMSRSQDVSQASRVTHASRVTQASQHSRATHDASRDVSRDVSREASRDASRDRSRG